MYNGLTCTNGTVSIACKTHTFGTYHANTETHWRTCSACKYKETGTHEFNHSCEGKCIICNGYVRAESHDIVMNRDESGHWYECSICKGHDPKSFHVPGPVATENTAQICTICGYVIQPALRHVHEYSPNLTANNQGHWHACSGCEEKNGYTAHRYENACSATCSDCGYSRKITHQYSDEWASNKDTHWHACSICGAKSDEANHKPGPDATEATAQTCTICGQEIVPAISNTPTAPTPNDADPFAENGTFHWLIIIIVAIVVSAAASSCVVLIILKKKK
jgi:hypothetical protein